jgi:hypothetical protein
MTMCGSPVFIRRQGTTGGRAVVIARDGNMVTFRWPCGYEKTEQMMTGVGRAKRPMSTDMVAFFARYWAQGVTYECPRCRREAMKKAKAAKK